MQHAAFAASTTCVLLVHFVLAIFHISLQPLVLHIPQLLYGTLMMPKEHVSLRVRSH